jgi:hypothetical protein
MPMQSWHNSAGRLLGLRIHSKTLRMLPVTRLEARVQGGRGTGAGGPVPHEATPRGMLSARRTI